MHISTTRSVAELSVEARQLFESLLGRTLGNGEELFVLAYTPASFSVSEARTGIGQIVLENQAYAEETAVTSDEADQVVDEAMAQSRKWRER